MKHVTIYTTQFCPYCHSAKQLLSRKGAVYTDVDVSNNPDERRRMTERAGGRRSVPQIFIGDMHVGGSDDLHALDDARKLDHMLAAT